MRGITKFGSRRHLCIQVVGSEGQQVGQILKGHKKFMAYKSSAFEAMFYGPLKEDKEPIVIEETTFKAFKNMLNFIHDITEDWSKVELPELLHTANLAERYHLPKMKLQVLEHLKSFTVTEDNLLKTAATAEEFSCLGQESEVLLQACSSFLEESLVTPGDLQKFMIKQCTKDDKQGMVGMRLLSQVKIASLAFAGGPLESNNEEKVIIWKIISIAKTIIKSSNTRSDLVKLKDLFDELEIIENKVFSLVDELHNEHLFLTSLVESLAKSIDFDRASAAAMGNLVQPEVVVEGSITHMQSVQVHLDLVKIILKNGDGGGGLWLTLDSLNDLWKSVVSNTVPEVHSVFFDWLTELIDTDNIDPSIREKMAGLLILYAGPFSASYHNISQAVTVNTVNTVNPLE